MFNEKALLIVGYLVLLIVIFGFVKYGDMTALRIQGLSLPTIACLLYFILCTFFIYCWKEVLQDVKKRARLFGHEFWRETHASSVYVK
mgnify:FL=1